MVGACLDSRAGLFRRPPNSSGSVAKLQAVQDLMLPFGQKGSDRVQFMHIFMFLLAAPVRGRALV